MISPLPSTLATHAATRAVFSQETAVQDELRRDTNIPLSIGVIGQIFSGKSRLLNALLFDGASLLPNAITPEMVHLTRIVHGKHHKLTVHYCTPEDWAALKRLAVSAATGMEAEVARSLVRSAQRMDIDIAACLVRRTEVVEAETLEEFLCHFKDYVGSPGRYNALVESVELALPLDALLGIEIVDTPSINDPMISRTKKTRDYLACCDVVFFLSSASRFLTEIDMDIISMQLPADGIKRLILVATHFGYALSDECYLSHSSLAVGERTLKERLTHSAHEMIERIATQREQDGYTDLAALLRASAMPIFMCGYMHAFATQSPESWNRSHHRCYEEFINLSKYVWGGQLPVRADWQRLSGFDALRDVFTTTRAGK